MRVISAAILCLVAGAAAAQPAATAATRTEAGVARVARSNAERGSDRDALVRTQQQADERDRQREIRMRRVMNGVCSRC